MNSISKAKIRNAMNNKCFLWHYEDENCSKIIYLEDVDSHLDFDTSRPSSERFLRRLIHESRSLLFMCNIKKKQKTMQLQPKRVNMLDLIVTLISSWSSYMPETLMAVEIYISIAIEILTLITVVGWRRQKFEHTVKQSLWWCCLYD